MVSYRESSPWMPPGMLRTPAATIASASVPREVRDLLGPVACSSVSRRGFDSTMPA
jgi:hypothetical protein